MEHVLIVDLSSVRFQWAPGRSTLAVQLGTGESVGIADVDPALNDREAALYALDAALDRGKVVRWTADGSKVRARIGFYNPHTAEVAILALPSTKAYTDGRPLSLPAEGQLAALDCDVLTAGVRTLDFRIPSAKALTAAWTAHQ